MDEYQQGQTIQGPINLTQEIKLTSNDYLEFGLRLFLVVMIIFGLIAISYFFISRSISTKILTSKKNILFVSPYKMMILEGFGVVSEPEVSLDVKLKTGYQKIKFLLDSGAVVSSLPRGLAGKMGYDLAFLPRTVFYGYGNKSSFSYKAEMTIKVGQKEITIPVVFTEMDNTQPLIGRKGFFDNFAIIFDAGNKQIIISEKKYKS